MKFETPATSNPIDQLKIVGQPVDRIDGPRKTTGTAPYAYERHDVARNQAYGTILGAGIAKGRINAMDTAAAKARSRSTGSSDSPKNTVPDFRISPQRSHGGDITCVIRFPPSSLSSI